MYVFWWVGANFVPGGSSLTAAMVNCFVHVIMYSYYALAALGPVIQKYLWWKKYLTILQLVRDKNTTKNKDLNFPFPGSCFRF